MNQNQHCTAVLLAAGLGTRIKSLTDSPKCLLSINSQTLLERHIVALENSNITNLIIVTGYKEAFIQNELMRIGPKINITICSNEIFSNSGNAYSLYLALKNIYTNTIIIDADLIYDYEIFESFLCDDSPNAFLCGDTSIDDIECSKILTDKSNKIKVIADKRPVTNDELNHYTFTGEAIGIIKLDHKFVSELTLLIETMLKIPSHIDSNWEFTFNEFIKHHDIDIYKTTNPKWIEIDTKDDFERAKRIFT